MFIATIPPSQIMSFSIAQEITLPIGLQIWDNECGKRRDLLVYWNQAEHFPSLGIGHFIWMPQDHLGPHYEEIFPLFITWLQEKNHPLPSWLNTTPPPPCPWKNREEFYTLSLYEEERTSLQQLMETTLDLQVEFMTQRLSHYLEQTKKHFCESENHKIHTSFSKLIESQQGIYALVDYLNFKGDGFKTLPQYGNIGWGLSQVLLSMEENFEETSIIEHFCMKAKLALKNRILNSPQPDKEQLWWKGWEKRIDSYQSFLISK